MRRALFLALVGVVSVASSTHVAAQSILEMLAGIKFCRTLKDDAERLKCFDGLSTDGAKPKAKNDSTVDPSWDLTEDKSPLDDSPQISALLFATNESTTGLILRCKEKRTEVIFTKQFGMFGIQESVRVVVRINEGKPIETRWSSSTTHTAAFAPSPIQFIRALPDDGTVFIRAFGYNGSQIDGTFKLGKVSAIRDKISQACSWPTR